MKNLKLPALLILITATLFLSSCMYDMFNYVNGDGIVTTDLREISDFTEVELWGAFDVYIEKDSFQSVEVEAESSLQSYILTGVKNKRLICKNRDNYQLKNTRPINIYIKTDKLEKISLSGSGIIEVSDTFETDHFKISLPGSGEVKAQVKTKETELSLSGSGRIYCYSFSDYLTASIPGSGKVFLEGDNIQSDISISGSGELHALDMIQDISTVKISGSGEVWLWVLNTLDVNISGSGTLYYKGSPDLYQNISGSGNIIKIK